MRALRCWRHSVANIVVVAILLAVFFFESHRRHRELHSFPTRRSSDLLGVPQIALGVDDFGQSGARRDLYRHYGIRSEEHTSELQSRGHLVCRLLLEKKTPNEPRRPRTATPPRSPTRPTENTTCVARRA